MIINRFLPNPAGDEKDGEWLELLNDGNQPVNLAGWQIKDLAGKTFTLGDLALDSGEALRLDYKQTKIALNNGGETLFLYDSGGNLVDLLSFSGTIAEGEIVFREAVEPNVLRDDTPLLFPENNLINAAPANFSVWLVGFGAAAILSAVVFMIIKKIYADYFDPVFPADPETG